MMKKKILVKVNHVSKNYILHHEKPTFVERLFGGNNEQFCALKDVSFEIQKGDVLGIIGMNGSGKTTLLKIISGITSPSSGDVQIYGKVMSLIDLEAGLHPDLNGEQNIYLNGMLLGIDKKIITKKMDEIKKFADIGNFMDAQLYTYSQGMKFRLAFSIIAITRPDILILDESFSVGDIKFQKKAIKKIKELNRGGTSIIMVSHWIDFIRKICNKIIVLKRGEMIYEGPSTDTPIKLLN